MDQLHHDLFTALDELSGVTDHEFQEGYGSLVSKLERAFRSEEQWMEESDFPAMRIHQEQHARVLGGLHNVHVRVMSGDLEIGRKVVSDLLPQWLAFHISTMDTALAVAMQMTRVTTGEATQPVH
jgi:hemerythrin